MSKLKIDEINSTLIRELYNFVDKVIGTLNRKYVALFNRLKNLEDEKEIIEEVEEIYKLINEVTTSYYLLIARKVRSAITDGEDVAAFITELWLMKHIYNEYNYVTKYVYSHEIDRKAARLAEAMIASDNKIDEIEKAKKSWAKQASQYADIIVNEVIEEAFEEEGEEYAIWHAFADDKVCQACLNMDGERIRLEDVHIPLHYGCRCYITRET